MRIRESALKMKTTFQVHRKKLVWFFFFNCIIQSGFILIEKKKRTQEASLFEAPDTKAFSG